MEETFTRICVLNALYVLARRDQPASPLNLAAFVGLTPAEVVDVLEALEERGLVDTAACRLTLHGLALIRAYRARLYEVHEALTLAA